MKAGDILQILVMRDQAYGVQPEEGEISVLFEDAQIIVLDKAAGQLVHPAGQTDGGTLANFLAHYFQSKGILMTIRPLHRLDRDTSGCVAFAKDARTQTEMEQQLQSGSFKRTYLALVQGVLEQDGVIDEPIGHCPGKPNRRMIRSEGDQAITYYRTVRTLSDASLLELSLDNRKDPSDSSSSGAYRTSDYRGWHVWKALCFDWKTGVACFNALLYTSPHVSSGHSECSISSRHARDYELEK